MQQLQIVLGLLVAVSVLAIAAQRLGLPYPIPLVLGGLALGFVPGLPRVQLAPDVAFAVFLPPLVYAASQATSLRDLRANQGTIGSLALGLALATVGVVAVGMHLISPRLGWSSAVLLGAIVAPTDPIAVAAIMHRLGVPRRVVVIVEAESLVNDAVGLVTYKIAVAAAVAGTFSLWQAGLQFLVVSIAGAVIGLAVGWGASWLHHHLDHTSVEITLTLLTPFAAYLPAAALGASGVLAVMTTGIYTARKSSTMFEPDTRLEAKAVWDMAVFLLNGLLFILIGLQLRGILSDIAAYPVRDVVVAAVAVCLLVVLMRPAWVFPAVRLPQLLLRSRVATEAMPLRQAAVISWAGMRGSASIAAALALPLTVNTGAALPDRSLITFLVFCVILCTLVLQGLSLPAVIRWLHVSTGDTAAREEHLARVVTAEAALAHIDRLAAEEWLADDVFERLHARYRDRLEQVTRRARDGHAGAPSAERAGENAVRREAVSAQRAALIRLRNAGSIDDEVLRRIERELDLEAERLRSLGA